jgi:hypothetical protein
MNCLGLLIGKSFLIIFTGIVGHNQICKVDHLKCIVCFGFDNFIHIETLANVEITFIVKKQENKLYI